MRGLLERLGWVKSSEAPQTKLDALHAVHRDVLDSSFIMFRSGTGDDVWTDRAIVNLPGRGAWIYSHEAAARTVSTAFPELSETAIGHAVKRLDGLVASRRRQHADAMAAIFDGFGRDNRSWRDRW